MASKIDEQFNNRIAAQFNLAELNTNESNRIVDVMVFRKF